MDFKCPVCGKEITELTYMNPQSKKVYCSKQCRNADNAGRILFIGILIFAFLIFFTIYLFAIDAPEMAAILSPIFFVFSLSMIVVGTRFTRLRNKIKEERMAPIYAKSVESIKKKEQFTCFFCGTLVTNNSKENPTICMTCGNKLLYCDLCDEYISKNEKVLQLEPCGHLFHKEELLDWTKNNKICPKCNEKIEFVDINPET